MNDEIEQIEKIEAKGHQKQPEYPSFWALAFIIAIFSVGVVLVILKYWRKGTFIMGFALVCASAYRAVAAPERAGLLVVRGKRFDVAFLLLAGASLMALAVLVAGIYI